MDSQHEDRARPYSDNGSGDDRTSRHLLWVAIGSTTIAAGSTIALINGFQGTAAPVYGGLILFVLGYRITQYGIHEHDPDQPLLTQLTDQTTDIDIKTIIMITIGGFALSYGFTTFIQSISNAALTMAGAGGLMMLGGYMIAHLAINNTLI